MIVAEIGLNHLGSEEYANLYLDQLFLTDVDGITFQIRESSFYNSSITICLNLEKKYYKDAFKKIKQSGKKVGVAIADIDFIDFCISEKVDFYKVIRNDIANTKLLKKLLYSTNKPIFVSTGMSSIKEIDNFFVHFKEYKERITLIHTQLSHRVVDVNLKAIQLLKNNYDINIGFGNHCENINVLYLATAFNPSSIFFYVKGNINEKYPDDEHAVLLSDVNNVIANLKALPLAFGSANKFKMENIIEKKQI
jgi:N,N'-diacetyllegionaminate synthase